MSPQVSRFIDAARWIAALAVLVMHVDANALVVFGDIPQALRTPFAHVVWFFYGFSHQAVVVFFVLSGFLVGGGVLKSARAGKSFLSGYLVDRTARIYVVLLPVLALTAILDALGRAWFADTGAYAVAEFANRSDMRVFIANLFNLQDIFFPYFGANSALWTLAHEYWYYVTFALLVMPLAGAYDRRLRWSAFALGVVLVVVMSASLSYHLFGFALWLSGVAAALVARPLLRSGRLALVAFLAVSIGIRLFVRYSWSEIWWVGGLIDAAVALGFANLLLTLRFDEGPVWRFSMWRGHRTLSDFSYSLYALHMPVLIFLCAAAQHFLGFGWRSVPTSAAHWALAGAILVCVAASAWMFSLATEAKTPAVRAFCRRLLESRAVGATAAGATAKG